MTTGNAAIDQEARDLAKAALADIRRHAEVCTEAEKRRDTVIDDIREALCRMEKSATTQRIDDAARTASAVDGLRKDLRDTIDEMRKGRDAQSHVNGSLYNRFWTLLLTWAGLMTGIAGILLKAKLGI
jgi:hypothetical protein